MDRNGMESVQSVYFDVDLDMKRAWKAYNVPAVRPFKIVADFTLLTTLRNFQNGLMIPSELPSRSGELSGISGEVLRIRPEVFSIEDEVPDMFREDFAACFEVYGNHREVC